MMTTWVWLHIIVFFSNQGDYFTAAKHFEAYYGLSVKNKEWTTADGTSFHTDACINLSRIYTTIGEHVEQDSIESMLEYLDKAYNKAKESKTYLQFYAPKSVCLSIHNLICGMSCSFFSQMLCVFYGCVILFW